MRGKPKPSTPKTLESSSAEVNRGAAAQTLALALLSTPQAWRWAPRLVLRLVRRRQPKQPQARWRKVTRRSRRLPARPKKKRCALNAFGRRGNATMSGCSMKKAGLEHPLDK
jgi:DNA-binding transcriptional LysR family regulator